MTYIAQPEVVRRNGKYGVHAVCLRQSRRLNAILCSIFICIGVFGPNIAKTLNRNQSELSFIFYTLPRD